MDDARLLLSALPDASLAARLRPVSRPLAQAAPPQAADRQHRDGGRASPACSRPGGELRLATDDPDYARWMLAAGAGRAAASPGRRSAPATGAIRRPTGCRPATRRRPCAAGRRPVFLSVPAQPSLSDAGRTGAWPERPICRRNGLRGRIELAIFRPHPLSADRGEWASARSLRVAVSVGTTSFSEVAQLIEPTLRDMGFELVQVRMVGGSRRTLQVMAEPLDRDAPHDRRRLRRDQPRDLGRARRGRSDSRAPTRSRSARPASIGRWCAVRISCGSPASRPRSSASRPSRVARGFGACCVVWRGRGGGRGGEAAPVRIPFASIKKAKLTLSAALAQAGGRRARLRLKARNVARWT